MPTGLRGFPELDSIVGHSKPVSPTVGLPCGAHVSDMQNLKNLSGGSERYPLNMAPEAHITASANRRALRVLIVEDETLISLFLQGVLRDLGHSVSGIAPSLRTALAVAAGTPSDIAIVDVGLAGDGGDGIDTAAALRARHGIPSLLMTGASFAELGDRIQSAQPVGFLTKPYTESDVESALNGALDNLDPPR